MGPVSGVMVSGANGLPKHASRADFPKLSLREGARLVETVPKYNRRLATGPLRLAALDRQAVQLVAQPF